MLPEAERRSLLTAYINSYDELREALHLLEEKFDVRIVALTRGDVNNEFSECHQFDGDGAKDMTDAQWERFTGTWFWEEGYFRLMMDDDLWTGIRHALLDENLIPPTSVVG